MRSRCSGRISNAHPRHPQRFRSRAARSRRSSSRRSRTRRSTSAAQRPLLDNVRLWDWQPFHDTITQIQALRPYYVFHDTDVDRYTIDGQIPPGAALAARTRHQPTAGRARQLDQPGVHLYARLRPGARGGQQDHAGRPARAADRRRAAAQSRRTSLKLTRPELYYGEVTHEPVFVHTAQEEFNYPSGEQNASSTYEGKGGFPDLVVRHAARGGHPRGRAQYSAHRLSHAQQPHDDPPQVRDRLQELAGFLEWDTDPYLVITDAGRLVWMVDGYTTSDAHPYSRAVEVGDMGRINYIRNAVKATVDAYDGETHLYVFAPDDPIIAAYQRLFPDLSARSRNAGRPAAHARYPETLFRVQAEIYRTYHMLDPQAFYNKEDLWDIALHAGGQSGGTGRR